MDADQQDEQHKQYDSMQENLTSLMHNQDKEMKIKHLTQIIIA